MDKKKLIATIAAISLSVGTVGVAAACDNNKEPPHEHTFDTTQWVTDGGDTHWHPSTCGHDDVKDGEESHVDEDGDKFCDKCDQDMRQTIAVTIAPTTGGSVTLDKTAPKEGETVTVTVTANEGYTLSSVKLGTEEKTLDANGKFTFTASAAVTITATFEAKTITLDASALNAEHGAVAFKFVDGKTEYKYGESVALHVTEKGYYKIQSLYINGDTTHNYADDMSEDGDILIPSCKKESLTITGTFVIGYKDIEVTFGGKRMGNDVVLSADSGVTVGGYDSVTVGADGKATLVKAEIGKTYIVGANGFNSGSFKVEDADAYNVTLQWRAYDCFTVNESNRDVSHFNDGYITTNADSSDVFLYTQKFIGDNAIFTTTFKSSIFAADTGRSYVGFLFGDKLPGDQSSGNATWYNKQVVIHLINETNRRMEWMGGVLHKSMPINSEVWNIKDSVDDDSGFNTHLPQSVLDKWDGDGVELTIIRKDGRYIYAFVDGLYVGKCDIGEEYVGQLAAPAICAPGTVKNYVLPFSLTEGETAVDDYLTANGAVSTDSVLGGVTVTSNKTGECVFMDEVELTVTVPAGKRITAFEVDGNNVIDDLAFTRVGDGNAEIYTYSFNKRRGGGDAIAVHVVTEDVVLADLDVTVKGKKLGVTTTLSENTVVKFKGSRYTFNVDANGKISQTDMAAGTYTVQVNGYKEQQITVGGDAPITEIVLDYDTFKELLHWGNFDFDDQNADTPMIGATNDCSMIMTNDTYAGDVMSNIYLKGNGVEEWNNNGTMKWGSQGLLFRFFGEGLDANGETAALRMEDMQKVQFADYGNYWGAGKNAEGNQFKNLIDFTGDNAHYLDDFAAGTLKLTALRKGATIYAFLNDTYIGQQTLASKYAHARCEVGFIQDNTVKVMKKWKIGITEDIPSVSITGNTEDTNGTIEIENAQNIKLGDVVTVNYTPARGYILDEMTVVGGTDVKRSIDNSITFVATAETVSVVATFKEGVEFDVPVAKAVGLNNTQIDLNGKTLLFKPATGAAIPFVVANDKVHCAIAKGTYTVSVDETAAPFDNKPIALYYDIEVEVGDSGIVGLTNGLEFTRKILTYNLINEGNVNTDSAPSGVDNTTLATDGYITATKDCVMYEWTVDKYADAAISITVKNGNGNHSLIAMFEDTNKMAVRARIEGNHVQWNTGWEDNGNWWTWSYGTQAPFINIWNFGSGEDYASDMSQDLLTKYNNGQLKMTLLRRGAFVYVLIDGKVYSAQNVSDWANKKINFAILVEGAKTDYSIPVDIVTNKADLDKIFADACDSNGVLSVLGKFTTTAATDSALATLAVSGNGYAEFAPAAEGTKESLAVTLKNGSSNAGKKAQGVVYRFADGKWIAARMESSDSETYIQYADYMILPKTGGSLTGWALVKNFDKSLLDDGVSLKMVRDGKMIYVYLGDEVIDIKTLDDKYATMDGTFAATIEAGTGNPFGYEYKSGDDVVIGEYSKVNVSVKDNAAHGYDISVDKTYVENGNSVTLTIKTGSNWLTAWSYFPTSVKVDGEEKFDAADMVSNGANRLTYTLTVENVTADTNIEVTIAKGTKITNGVLVTVAGEVGGTATCDSGADGYYWNDGCDIYITPDDGYEIASISYKRHADDGEPIVVEEGWVEGSGKYTYTLPISITEPTDVVVTFREVAA